MQHKQEDDNNMETIFYKKELEASLARNNLLEKENQELRLEIARLKTQITTLKAHNNERKTILWKKLQTSFDSGYIDSSPQKPQPVLVNIEQQPVRVPQPPPKPNPTPHFKQFNGNKLAPPPPPPPLPLKSLVRSRAIRRVPEVLEFYRLLTRRDNLKESMSCNNNQTGFPPLAFTKNMIGEIENRSAYLSSVRSNVETHAESINFLIGEVESATFSDISEVDTFVKWLDEELSSLVDERAVLKHFPEWPERKADALREAAFSYRDLTSLESEVCSFEDIPKEGLGQVLRRAQTLQDRLEQIINNTERTRESISKKYKDFHIPWEWLMDSGLIGQMKLSSLRLAKKYMKRIGKELQDAECSQVENILLQGVRFAYRVHQFAGGFDSETILAFEELRKVGKNICQRK